MLNNILISRETRKVLSKDNRFIGIEGENLQEVLVFKLDEEIDGNAVIEIQFRDETKGFIEVEKTERGYELPVRSSLLTQEGITKMQLRILKLGQEVFKSEIIRFDVQKAINATATIPDEYPTWIDNLEILKSSLEKAETERAETFTQMSKEVDTAIENIKDMTVEYNTNATEKMNEFNENAQEKLEEYNANVKVIEPRIIELENENEMLKNQIPTGQAEGENITLNDSAEMEFKELRIGGNSIQDGTPPPETPIEIQNVKGSANITVCNKNLLPNNFEKYNVADGIYGYYKLPFADRLLILSIKDKNTSIDMTGVYFGFTTNGVNANNGKKWIIENGILNSTTGNINNLINGNVPYFSFYPKNEATFNKIFQRYHVQVELDEVTHYIEHKTQVFTFPLLEGQKLCRKNEKEYDYLDEKGIVNILEQIDDTGTKTIEESFEVREMPLVTAYTEEQQLVYNEIKKAKSYKNVTNIFSTDETSPIFEVTYRKDLETMFNKLTNTETVQEMIDNSVGSTIGGEY